MNTILENRSFGSRYSAKNNLHHSAFYCNAPEAEHVALSGDFNHWHSTPMSRMSDGRWMASLELPHGYHHYIFLVDDRRVLDPNAYGIMRNSRIEPVSLMALS
jgi:1,4-alpha-glucan branching enzyme